MLSLLTIICSDRPHSEPNSYMISHPESDEEGINGNDDRQPLVTVVSKATSKKVYPHLTEEDVAKNFVNSVFIFVI